jgi:SAM-dependent methyltransferase
MSYFNHYADSPSTLIGDYFVRKSSNYIFSTISRHLAKTCSILEIGPGKGDLLEQFRFHGYTNYSVVEPNLVMAKELEDKGIVVNKYRIPSIQEPDDLLDAIILVNVFEHLNDASEAAYFMSEANRVLRKNGILCIAAPDYLHWKDEFFNSDYTHSNITTLRRALQLYYNHGFDIEFYSYNSAWLSGALSTIFSNFMRFSLFFANSNGFDKKLYKLKLTFLRRFLIIGKKS